jgi:hypothetical protein
VIDLERRDYPKLGENVVVGWKKADGSVLGGTEGVALGVLGDEDSGEYLVIDRSTYQDSFKSALFDMKILDLKIFPVDEIDFIKKRDVRKRPPGVSEKYTWLMDVYYHANIDFNSTVTEVQKRRDCTFKPDGNQNSEAYQLVIKEIRGLEGTSFNISCRGTVQITCKHDNLDRCIDWLQKAVVLLPKHKRLVLIPTQLTYKIFATYKDPVRSTDELVDQIALDKDGPPIVLPIGWAHRFFSELDENPLQGLFPEGVSIYDYVTKNEKSRKNTAFPRSYPIKENVDLNYNMSGISVSKYLGTGAPIMRVNGLIKTPKDEEGLMNLFFANRSTPWQWFEWGPIHGKTIIRDLTINRKKGNYTVEFRKYSGNDF